ncbi:hypothetical protein NC652_030434 [Populus alba x Populus x berolinensis]|nr:hypothetical protein NC652_030434 [Populus alba x Populus x berolinensis]
MVLKRPFQFDGGEDGFGLGGTGVLKNQRGLGTLLDDVMGRLSVNDFMSKMEPLLRAVVRDEVERTVLRGSSIILKTLIESEQDIRRPDVLHFVTKLPSTIFTGGKLEAEDGSPIRVVVDGCQYKDRCLVWSSKFPENRDSSP